MRAVGFCFAMFLVAINVVGCHSKNRLVANTYNDESSTTHYNKHVAEMKLLAAADSVSKSLAELAAIEKATHPQARLLSPVDAAMIGMNKTVSIDWSGPVQPLIKEIADASGYRLNVLGKSPGIPILVSISAKDTLLADILRDANFQCGNKANVVVYPASKLIELRYTR